MTLMMMNKLLKEVLIKLIAYLFNVTKLLGISNNFRFKSGFILKNT